MEGARVLYHCEVCLWEPWKQGESKGRVSQAGRTHLSNQQSHVFILLVIRDILGYSWISSLDGTFHSLSRWNIQWPQSYQTSTSIRTRDDVPMKVDNSSLPILYPSSRITSPSSCIAGTATGIAIQCCIVLWITLPWGYTRFAPNKLMRERPKGNQVLSPQLIRDARLHRWRN